MSDQVIWEDPPGDLRRTRAKKWFPVLKQVMARPGEWARIHTSDSPVKASSLAGNLSRGQTSRPSGRWEFMSRKITDTEWGVWARYLGPEGGEASS
jgi:hypothetical protein